MLGTERRFEQQQFDGQASGGSFGPKPENFGLYLPDIGTVNEEVLSRIDSLVETAKKDAIERTNGSPEAILRVTNAIERRFRPYVEENEIIGQQISSPEYEASIYEVDEYIQGRMAAVGCDDGRITNDQIGGPRETSVSRRLQGLPEVRWSTKNKSKKIIKDPDITSSIKIYIEKQKGYGNTNPIIIEFPGGHIFSTNPVHGCGKEKAKIEAAGGTVEVNMWDGGINDYYDELGEDGFEAFNNTIEMLGGKGVTFDTTHDAYSQGLIFGLKEARHEFKRDTTLRQNLIELAHNGKILMTELLDRRFRQQIKDMARDLGFDDDIDLNDFRHFGRNQILISKIALEITKQQETAGFEWIPPHLINGVDTRAVRALGYTALRNVTRRVLGNIQLGDHELQDHPEQVIRIGPIGADFNIQAIPFIHHTASGLINTADANDTGTLSGLLKESLEKYHHVDFRDEGRIIMTTGIFDRKIYANDGYAEEARETVNSVVGENAARIRDKYARGVANGEIIVIGCLHEPGTRSLTDIVK